MSLWCLQSAWSAIAKQQIAFARTRPLFAVQIAIRPVVLERSQRRGGVLEARSEERLGACLFSRHLLRPPLSIQSLFWGALVSQDLNSKVVYGICFSSLTWEVSAGSVDGRAAGELGMPACEEVSGLFQL